MDHFLVELQHQKERVEAIAAKIEQGQPYMDELKSYLPTLNQTIRTLFEVNQNTANPFEIDQNFVLQVLNDIIYGIEKEDSVCLADVLRYGLLEIYDYAETELQQRGPS